VRLAGRAFDILTTLVERAADLVSKEELIARAWPTTLVDDANLKIQVSALRRPLGDGQGDNRRVATVVRRGYNSVAPVREEEPPQASPSPTIAPSAPHNQPFATTRMIGRKEIATKLVAQLSHQRLMTVVGPGDGSGTQQDVGAGLLRGQGRPDDAIACLKPILDRFTEGFATADLVAAKRLLDHLGGTGRR